MATYGEGMIEVREAVSVDSALVEAFQRLIPQLSTSSPPPDAHALQAIVDDPDTHLLIAHDEESAIVGTTTLAVFRIPTGVRAWIEDVVVDAAAGGKGVGKALTRHALDVARREGAKTVDLTSRPSREVANGMYRKIGFEARETNVYRFDLKT